jgi:hypothetical protein
VAIGKEIPNVRKIGIAIIEEPPPDIELKKVAVKAVIKIIKVNI